MTSNMCVKVEFLVGTDIDDAVQEAKSKAALWQVAYVTFDFNGCSFSIGANANVDETIEEWHTTKGKPYGICAN